jgi:hypothetical protein
MSSTVKPMNINGAVTGTINIPSSIINTGMIGATGAVGASGIVTNLTMSGGGAGGGMISTSGNYTMSTGSYGTTAVSKPVYYTITDNSGADIVIPRNSGESIRVGDTIKHILDTFCIIVPDQNLLDSNPALKAAYENHQAIIQETLGPKLKESYDSYKTIEKLIQQDKND